MQKEFISLMAKTDNKVLVSLIRGQSFIGFGNELIVLDIREIVRYHLFTVLIWGIVLIKVFNGLFLCKFQTWDMIIVISTIKMIPQSSN